VLPALLPALLFFSAAPPRVISPAPPRVISPAPPRVISPAPPRTATAPLPLAGPDALPQRAGKPETLYINFDGAVLRRGCGNDSRHDCSSLADTFNGYVGPFVGTTSRRLAIVQSVRKDLEDIGVRAITRRPDGPDADYTMVLYGDLGAQDFAGIAPYVDCGNLWPNDTCFAGAYLGSNVGATVILQEAAHTWGLEHVNSEFDNLHPFVAQPTPYFQDKCNKIVSNTDLVEVGGACNSVHELFCEAGYQNSYQELLYLFGPAVPDTVAPTITLTSPEEGSVHVFPAEGLSLQGVIHDDLDPQFYTITVKRDGATIIELEDVHIDLRLVKPPAGEYDLRVTAVDGGGNTGSARVRFTVLPEGSEDPDTDSAGTDSEGDTDSDTDTTGGPDSDGGNCRLSTTTGRSGRSGRPPPFSLAALLLLVRRRRR